MRAGLWRFMDAFAAHNIASTYMMCGRAVERSRVGRAVGDDVHETGGCMAAWRRSDYRDIRKRERANIGKDVT